MSNDKNILFQILDWDSSHIEDDEGNKKFIARLFGKTKENKSIYVEVEQFTPYFYVEIGKNWRKDQCEKLIEQIKYKIYPKELVNGLKQIKYVDKHKFYEFTNYEKFRFMQLIFSDYDSMKKYATAISQNKFKCYQISKDPIKLTVYESNIHPILRLMHIRQLSAVGWVTIPSGKYKTFDEDQMQPSTCEISVRAKWTDLHAVDDRTMQKFTICSFDLECTSEDGSFPNPKRPNDKIIQIGMTFSRFGEDECYYKHILCLNKTDNIAGAVVDSFDTEEDMLLEFSKLIRQLDPDVITGYNIFGFDFQYLMERAKLLDIYTKFSRLSRVKGEISEFITQVLQSSALGKNELKYYKMTGRIIIDLMKVIQRDYKLPGYKLDAVASYFIRESIIEFKKQDNQTKILTKNTNGIYVDQYIQIGYNDGITENRHLDGRKFKVVEVTKDSILVDKIIEVDDIVGKGFKIFWSQAKDDVSPQDIFKMFRGTSAERAIVAKYCLQDSALCNKLMYKLQILTNNIGMANVCHVPLSYIFLRGQGVKIFSLVAKKCREVEHLIKVVKKKKQPDAIAKVAEYIEKYSNNKDRNDDYDDEEETGYEGATVFPPESGLHFDHVPVLDYASLYPNSMILRNLSHEMLVKDERYENIPGYRYHEIMFKNSDNTTTSCKFAEKLDGSKGIVPIILMELLAARKSVRQEAARTEDKFLASVLEGLQLAYKTTANSLYGQTGAPTSPIFMKEIAASTTATGREALQFSRYFIENVYNKLVLHATKGEKEEFMKYGNQVYTTYPNIIKTEMIFENIFIDYKYIFNAFGFNTIDIKEKFKNTFENEPTDLKYGFYNSLVNLYKGDIKMSEFITQNEKYLKKCGFIGYDKTDEEFENDINVIRTYLNEDQTDEFFDRLYLGFYNQFHVHTDKAFPIPEKVFNRKEIGYEIETNILDTFSNDFKKLGITNNLESVEKLKILFEDNYKKLGDVTKQKPEILKKFINDSLNELIFLDISKMPVIERRQFINDFNKLTHGKILFEKFMKKQNKYCMEILDKFSKLDINKNTLINCYENCDKEKVYKYFDDYIDNMGYSGKSEMLEKLYDTMSNLLTGFEMNAKIIYGDSVTPDTPIMLRYFKDGEYYHTIKTIDDIGKNWKPYDQFKKDDNSLTNKECDDNINYEVWSSDGWSKIKRVIRHKTNKKLYEVLTHTGCVRVTEDHSLLTPEKEQIKPKDCKVGTELLHHNLEINNFNAELFENEINIIKNTKSNIIETNTQIEGMKIYYVLLNFGYFVKVDKNDDKYILEYSKEKIEDNSNKIKKIREIGLSNDYVYDIETEVGNFHAGVGNMIVKNTDSVFFKPRFKNLETGEISKDKKGLLMAIIVGIWGSIMITTLLPPPMAQEYEKVLWPFAILTKKRYVGNLYEKNPNKFSQKSMGIVLKRRDNAPIVKVVCGGIIDQMLNKRSAEGAIDFTKKALNKIVKGGYKLDKFVITKTLKGPGMTASERAIEEKKPKEEMYYKNRSGTVHAVLADRMTDRDPGNRPQSNDRIPYVYMETKTKSKLQGDRVEHPDYLVKNNLKLDYIFYITNQIMKPAMQFLELIVENPEELFKSYIIREENRRNGVVPIQKFLTIEDIDKSKVIENFFETIEVEHTTKKKFKK